MSAYKSVNPATGETLQEFAESTDAEINQAVTAAHGAFASWRNEPVENRTKVITRVAELYRERAEELAKLIALEMGKPLREAKNEVALSANIYEYYATQGPGFMADEQLDVKGGGNAVVRTEPVGALLGIMPWNYPYYQVARFAGPNLMLGNTVLLKHANNCPQSALAMAQIFADAGVPEGAYVNLFATNEQAADIIADPRIQGVSLTGSERAGSAVAEVAGRNLKKYVLELGGSDPFIVLDTEDLDATVKAAVAGRMGNGGQACNAAKRFIVMEDLYDDFVEKFTARMSAIEPGDPLQPETRFGPLSTQAAADGLVEQIRDAVDKGATLHTGGSLIDGPGAYVQPTVLTGVTPEMRAFSEELFGPAAVIYKVASEEEAIELANNSPFGLGGAVFSTDEDRALDVADRLESGMVWINGTSGTQEDLPFGGVKRSGVGRELGRFGMAEFVNKKLIRTPRKQ
ncbi:MULTISPECIES: NAD-dependent succinate-semialdehyde dehydrogenase [unclassified Arthrobacter]|uniref:NAD-dependent succinate-semialdehyde dehydrogenase n=1 Tax=unclassified Arthrobacter TaxID=235627 RepID=UPI001E363A6A|nr:MULTISPECIES: NAD-dependent succinate-semialdehyde dehydrogenase [unclassified Arthrobacter]MCC9144566.1 NAD-dependent succinate-semialdehyde dehydrogenase [Arthrobacter sp. zg-Y919]MDK1275792.1 NAD-dependent succinate-semialdehyde dehydrogenase [Arthrobacter sp. zg.Y919]MDM7991423.1 NAD-dependent succinate-semialdehyde dehydrogenase [Arthrobacter sp. zg-Y877]WIB02844.1 NAD-dependent succinate-semialdehyde dehydrogenase [Arthrobacter sp. zg-Y919]